MTIRLLQWATVLVFAVSSLHGQDAVRDSTHQRFFVGGSLFMLANLDTNDPNRPDFVQLNVGYHVTRRDVLSVEFQTWKYAWPLGIPLGPSRTASGDKERVGQRGLDLWRKPIVTLLRRTDRRPPPSFRVFLVES